MFGVETYECAGDFDKNRYNFYMNFILLIDRWHIIFFNDCSWCELSENIYGVDTVESLEMLYF